MLMLGDGERWGAGEDPVVPRAGWGWEPRTPGQLVRAPTKGFWGPRIRGCYPESLTLYRAQQGAAAAVALPSGLVHKHSFPSKSLLERGGPEGTLGAKGNPAFPFCRTSSSQEARSGAETWVGARAVTVGFPPSASSSHSWSHSRSVSAPSACL